MNAIFITVRSGSTRLPNKSVIEIFGKPTIQYLIDNMKKVQNAEKIILCTTTLDEDDVLCQIAKRSGIECFRGSVDDKLSRWLGACEKYAVDFFVNVDGDDLFFDNELVERVILQYNESRPDFIDGQGYLYNDVYGIPFTSLVHVCERKSEESTEYIKPHFNDSELFIEKVKDYDPKWKKKNIRMTLDYDEDLQFFETVINGLGEQELTFDNISNYLTDNPNVVDINWHMENEWKKRQSHQMKIEKDT